VARSAPWMCTRSPRRVGPDGGQRPASLCRGWWRPCLGQRQGPEQRPPGRLAEQLQVASDARSLIRQAKARSGNAWMTRRPWSTSGERPGHPGPNRLPGGETVAGLPCPMGEPSRQGRLRAGARSWTWGPWTPKSPPHWNGSRADGGIGPRLSLLLLGFLATEVVPLANRAAELGFDPTPVFAATSGNCGCTPTPWSVPTFAGDGDARGRGPPLACQPHHPDTTKRRGSRRGLGADTQLPQVLDGLAA